MRAVEPLTATMVTRGTSKSTVSRRFVAKTRAQLEAWQLQPLDSLDLVGAMLQLVGSLRARDQQLGLVVDVENVAQSSTGPEFQQATGDRRGA